MKTNEKLTELASIDISNNIEVHPAFNKMSYMAQQIVETQLKSYKVTQDVFKSDIVAFEHFIIGLEYRYNKIMFHFIEALKTASMIGGHDMEFIKVRVQNIKQHFNQ